MNQKLLEREFYLKELEDREFCLVPTRLPPSTLVRVMIEPLPDHTDEAGPHLKAYGRNVLLMRAVPRPGRFDLYEAPLWALHRLPLKRARVIEGPVTDADVRNFVEAAEWFQESDLGPLAFMTTSGPLWPIRAPGDPLNVIHKRMHRLHPARYIPAIGHYPNLLSSLLLLDWGTHELRFEVEQYVRAHGASVRPNSCGVEDIPFYHAHEFLD